MNNSESDIFIEKYDTMMSDLTTDVIETMIIDQVDNPGESTKNYYAVLKGSLNKEQRIDLANRIADMICEKFNIQISEDIKDSEEIVQVSYNLYRLFIINIIPAMTTFLKEYIFAYTKKKSFLKTYGHIKPQKPNRVFSREAYIIFTHLSTIIADVCDSELSLKQFLSYVAIDSSETISEYILDLLEDNVISEEESVKAMYKVLKSSHMIETINLKLLMEYKRLFVVDEGIGFIPSEELEIYSDEVVEEY